MKQLISRNEFISYARMTKYTAKSIMNTISKSRNLPYFYCRLIVIGKFDRVYFLISVPRNNKYNLLVESKSYNIPIPKTCH